MKKLVIIPGGFHPFHAGHKALYDAAREAFPSADIYVAATADTSTRPFPFDVKKKLARIAGIDGHRFIQVKSPFRAEEITQHYDPANTVLIFARSEKDRDQQPKAGGVKKNGEAAYLQPYKRNGMQPMNQHGYMVYLPTVQFGPGMTSATEIRAKWPSMDAEQKLKLVQQLYPDTMQKAKLADVIVQMLDHVMGGAKEVDEAVLVNDPDAGHQIRPDGGFGTWDEPSLVNNLARKFAAMVEMVKAKNYTGLQHVLYNDRVVKSMVDALAEYEQFMNKQGRRPIARGREIDMSRVTDRMNAMENNNDYLDEGDVVSFPTANQAPPNVDQAHRIAAEIVRIAKDETIADPGPELARLRDDLRRIGYRLRMDNGGMRLIHNATNWNTIIDPMK